MMMVASLAMIGLLDPAGSRLSDGLPTKRGGSGIVDWVSVAIAPHAASVTNHSARARLLHDFAPDTIDWSSGLPFDVGGYARSRGIATAAASQFEYEEALQFTNRETVDLFGSSIAVNESGGWQIQEQFGRHYFMEQLSPPWTHLTRQGLVRGFGRATALTQDNIASTESKSRANWGNVCNAEFLASRGADLGLDPSFQIRHYVAHLRRLHSCPLSTRHHCCGCDSLLRDRVLREFIRFSLTSQLARWNHTAALARAAGVGYSGIPYTDLRAPSGVPTAIYGNQMDLWDMSALSIALSRTVDVVWVENSWNPQPVTSVGAFAAFSVVLYKLGEAASSGPVWSYSYPSDVATARVLFAEAQANRGVPVIAPEDLGSELGRAQRDHAAHVAAHPSLFVDRRSVADVALVVSVPTTMWRMFSSVIEPLFNVARPPSLPWVGSHTIMTATAARLLSESHILYDIVIFGHADLLNSTFAISDLAKYKSVVLAGVDAVSDTHSALLREYASSGGTVVLLGAENAGTLDEDLNVRAESAFHTLPAKRVAAGAVRAMFEETNRSAQVELAKHMCETTGLQNASSDSIRVAGLPRSAWITVHAHGNARSMRSISVVSYDFDTRSPVSRPLAAFTLGIPCQNDAVLCSSVANLVTPQTRRTLVATERDNFLYVSVPARSISVWGTIVVGSSAEMDARMAAAFARRYLNRLQVALGFAGSLEAHSASLKQASEQLDRIQGEGSLGNGSAFGPAQVSQFQRLSKSLNSRLATAISETHSTEAKDRSDRIGISAERRFDLGHAAPAKGWIPVTRDTVYHPGGYGWTGLCQVSSIDGGDDFDALHRDSLFSNSTCSFRVDGLQAQSYTVAVLVGSSADTSSMAGPAHAAISELAVADQPVAYASQLDNGELKLQCAEVNATAAGDVEVTLSGSALGPEYGNRQVAWMAGAIVLQATHDQQRTPEIAKCLARNEALANAALRLWSWVGPFDDRNSSGIDRRYSAADGNTSRTPFSARVNRTLRWQPLRTHGRAARLDFGQAVGRYAALGSVAFATTCIRSRTSANLWLVGSSSGIGRVMVDGAPLVEDVQAAGLVGAEFGARVGVTADQWHRVVVQSHNNLRSIVASPRWEAWLGALDAAGSAAKLDTKPGC